MQMHDVGHATVGAGFPSGFRRDPFKQLVLLHCDDCKFFLTQLVATEMAKTRVFMGDSPARPYKAGVILMKCPDCGTAGTSSPE